jgi:predicted RNase H-like nuclease (RuvC/YqgF family)
MKPAPRRTAKPAKRPNKTKRATPATRVKAGKSRSRPARKSASALEREVHRLRQARGRLERRLTAAVQEIGVLRQLDARVQALEAEVARRDAEIAELRRDLGERSREAEALLGEGSISSSS